MSEINVSKCEYYYEYPSNDIECNSALEGDNCKKVCHNKDCKWSLCSENKYCEYKVNWYIQQLKAENEKLSTQNYYLDKANLGLAEENENYLQCLDEIKEIANAIINGTHFTTDIEEHFKELTKLILQLIKQAKGCKGEKNEKP